MVGEEKERRGNGNGTEERKRNKEVDIGNFVTLRSQIAIAKN